VEELTPYGDYFNEGLEKVEKLLKICMQTNVCLSTMKCHMILKEGIVLGHLPLVAGIRAELAKVEVILNFSTPKTPTQVCGFIDYVGYYRHFIENFSMIEFPLFQLLPKDVEFLWVD